MKCIEAQQLVKPYIKRQLSDRETEAFLDHVENCPVCYDELEVYYAIYETLEDSRDEQGREQYNFKERLRQDMKSVRRYLYWRRAYRLFRFAIILLAEFLLICTVVTGFEMRGKKGSHGTTIYRVMYGIRGNVDHEESQTEAYIARSPAKEGETEAESSEGKQTEKENRTLAGEEKPDGKRTAEENRTLAGEQKTEEARMTGGKQKPGGWKE